MYDDVATLKKQRSKTYDEVGNPVITYDESQVFVQPRGVYHSEFYSAAQSGLSPSITFRLANRADYNGEKLIEYRGVIYEVVRVDWTAQRDRVDLICEERTNG